MKNEDLILNTARALHGAISALSNHPISWEGLDSESKELSISAVRHLLENPPATPEEAHQFWMETKMKAGWVRGDYDLHSKLHPCLVPYSELPDIEKLKDAIWVGVINQVKSL